MISTHSENTLTLVPYQARDRAGLTASLGTVLARLYPDGEDWLARRLSDVEDGSARCTVARYDGRPVAAAIETPKQGGRVKLSTLWIHPGWRGLGIGSALTDLVAARWRTEQISEADLTCDLSLRDAFERLLVPLGFALIRVIPDRYGVGRDEAVFSWLASDALRVGSNQSRPRRSAVEPAPKLALLPA
jgi:ribosomal protein S18 acetylase RimI-like enzyme